MLEPDTFDRIPKDTPWSIERSFFPSLIERAETFVAYVSRGYWIDIGTPEKYMQVHRDIMDRHYTGHRAIPFAAHPGAAWVSPDARVEDGAHVDGEEDRRLRLKRGAGQCQFGARAQRPLHPRWRRSPTGAMYLCRGHCFST